VYLTRGGICQERTRTYKKGRQETSDFRPVFWFELFKPAGRAPKQTMYIQPIEHPIADFVVYLADKNLYIVDFQVAGTQLQA